VRLRFDGGDSCSESLAESGRSALGLSKACSLDRGCRRSHGGGATLCGGGGKGLVICILFFSFLFLSEKILGDGDEN
jgi:hypothetical protein